MLFGIQYETSFAGESHTSYFFFLNLLFFTVCVYKCFKMIIGIILIVGLELRLMSIKQKLQLFVPLRNMEQGESRLEIMKLKRVVNLNIEC